MENDLQTSLYCLYAELDSLRAEVAALIGQTLYFYTGDIKYMRKLVFPYKAYITAMRRKQITLQQLAASYCYQLEELCNDYSFCDEAADVIDVFYYHIFNPG